ncbi:MAG: conjugal transfer protein TraF [candidate division Zixibacteria bacterium]|nr:conjugal transfer protein TraF [candidate division Zixibacteria bacterium]
MNTSSNYKAQFRNRSRTVAFAALSAILLILAVGGDAHAYGLSSARAVAMGGAYTGLAKGVYAGLYNPANLGLDGYRQNGLEIIGAGARISNNSFTLNDYNDYTGAILTTDDKNTILNKIPVEGLKISADAEATAMSLSFGNIALTFNGLAATESNLGKDAMRLILNGNGFNETFSLDGMYSEAIAYATGGVSYGTSLLKLGSRQLSIGATAKYIRGIAYEEVTDISGGATTLITGFEGEGNINIRTATGGTGYGLDLGAALKLSHDYTIGVTFTNLFSHITWNNETQEHGYYFQFDTTTTDNMDDDSVVISEDYSRDIDDFTSSLPTVMRLGIANTSGRLLWAIDWEQGFRLGAGTSSKPRIAVGAEYHLIPFMPLRAGYAAGGGKAAALSGGSGFDFGLAYMDFAVSNHSTFNFSESKGLHFAISAGIRL